MCNNCVSKIAKEIREEKITVKGVCLPENIAKGKVLKNMIYRADPIRVGEITEISILYLYPGSQILEHTHTVDREVYYVGNLQLACEAGQSHSYENATGGIVTIVAVKQAVK